ncbi:MAG: exodeoxyribonuclease VII small subunit [Rhodospirillales bacterium]
MAKGKTADKDEIPEDIREMSFEAALEELEDIVRELETGEGDLDTSINGYTRGVFLKRHCEAKLKEAEARIEKIVVGADGAVDTEPLDDA